MNAFDETFDPEARIETQDCQVCGDSFHPNSGIQVICVDCMETLPLNEVITGRTA